MGIGWEMDIRFWPAGGWIPACAGMREWQAGYGLVFGTDSLDVTLTPRFPLSRE